MIEQRPMLKEVLTQIHRSVEPFFIHYTTNNHFKTTYNTLLKEISDIKYANELWTIITGASTALRYGNTRFYLPRSKNVYSTVKKFNGQSVSYRKMVVLCELLEELGFIEIYNGFYRSDKDYAKSFIDIKPSLIELLNPEVCKKYAEARVMDYVEVSYKTKRRNSKGRIVKDKHLLPIKGLYGINKIKRGVLEFNKLLSINTISIDGEDVNNIIYKRDFNRTLKGGGRWHTIGTFQTERSYLRKTILINGNPTSEADISTLYPAICYSLLGIDLPEDFDPYEIQVENTDVEELRKFCKVAFMCILFSETKQEAYGAVKFKLQEDEERTGKRGEVKFKSLHGKDKLHLEICKKLIKRNKELEQFFFTFEFYSTLQHYDSQICTKIIEHFTAKGIVVLSWHDSWVIETVHLQELIRKIREAWTEVIGDDKNFRYTIEFSNKPEFKFRPSV